MENLGGGDEMTIYTVGQAAEMLSVSDYTLRDWLRTGKIKGSKIGGGRLWRLTSKQIEEYMESCEREGQNE